MLEHFCACTVQPVCVVQLEQQVEMSAVASHGAVGVIHEAELLAASANCVTPHCVSLKATFVLSPVVSLHVLAMVLQQVAMSAVVSHAAVVVMHEALDLSGSANLFDPHCAVVKATLEVSPAVSLHFESIRMHLSAVILKPLRCVRVRARVCVRVLSSTNLTDSDLSQAQEHTPARSHAHTYTLTRTLRRVHTRTHVHIPQVAVILMPVVCIARAGSAVVSSAAKPEMSGWEFM